MPTLSSVPEGSKMGSKMPEVRKKICEALGIYPEEIEHTLPVGIGKERIEKLEALINQQIKSVLDELEGEAKSETTFLAPTHGVPLSTIQKIRSRYE